MAHGEQLGDAGLGLGALGDTVKKIVRLVADLGDDGLQIHAGKIRPSPGLFQSGKPHASRGSKEKGPGLPTLTRANCGCAGFRR